MNVTPSHLKAAERRRARDSRYASYCMVCIGQTAASMLTGYCIRGERCDRCGRLSDLAMVKLIPEIRVALAVTK